MNDDDLVARADEWLENTPAVVHAGTVQLVERLAAALRARDTDLATACEDRDAYKALYDDLHEATGCVDGYAVDQLRSQLAAARELIERAVAAYHAGSPWPCEATNVFQELSYWLASVSPPASGPEA